MKSRLLAVAAMFALVAGVASGCSAHTAPEPSPTPLFATEDEAFAAAEATYRAYVDALNQVDLSDPATFEEVYSWTTGESNANERKTISQMHADGWQVSGVTRVIGFHGDHADIKSPVQITALACTNVADVRVVDSTGQSVVASDRPDVFALRVDFVESDSTSTSLAIAASNAVEDERCTS